MAYLGRQPAIGRYAKLDDFASSFNGSTTTFNLTSGGDAQVVQSESQLIVSLGGIIQEPETDYTVSGSQISFTTAPISGDDFFAILFGDTFNVGVPSDNTIQNRHIKSDASIAMSKLDGSSGSLSALTVDNVILNGTTIGHTSDTDLMTLASGALTIAGTVNSTGNLGVNTASPAFTGSGGGIEVTNSTAAIVRAESSAGALQLKRDGSVGSLFDLSAGLALGASNSEVMRLLSGMILVGKTTTTITSNALQASLQIMGNAYNNSSISAMRWSANANGASINLGKSRHATVGSNTVVANGDELGKIDFSGDDGTDYQTLAGRISSVVNGTPGTGDIPADLVFSPGDGGSVSEALRITSASKVGIGTTSPQAPLHVAQAAGTLPSSSTNGVVIQKNSSTSDNAVISLIGGAAGDSRVEFGDAADRDIGMIRYTHSDNGMEFWTNTSEKMFLNSDGDLGIGTTGPRIHTTTYGTSATYLTITDATAAGVLELGIDKSANYYTVGCIQFFNANNADAANHDADGKVIGAIRVNTVTSDTNAGDDSGGNIIFDTKPEAGSLAERMRITSAGNVGIGSSTANALLHLTGGTDQKLILSGSGSPNINLNSSSGDDFLMQNHAGAFRIYNLTDSRQDLSIDGAGGTTLTGGIGVLSAAGSDSTGSVGVKLPNEKYIAWFDSGASGNTNTHIRSIANVLTLTSSNFNFVTGKVGIGISAPTAALHVYTEGSNYTHGAYLLVESANASMGGNAVFAGLKHAAAIGASYIPLKVTTAGTTLMQLGSAGQLGVGESSVTPANRSPLYHFTHDTDTGMDWVAANTLTFRTGNTERLRIASAGQFGIAGANYGTSGQVLTSQGASAAPQWADAGGGAWTLIGTVVASNSSSLTITGLTSTYDTYAVAISDMHSVNDGSAIHIFLGDSSEVYDDNDYSHHTMSTLCNSNSYAASSSTGVDGIKIAVEGNGNATNEGVGALFYIHTPSDGGTFPQISGTYTAQRPNDGVQYGGSFVGRLNQNITLDRIEIRMGSGNFASGRMTVWGIAHA